MHYLQVVDPKTAEDPHTRPAFDHHSQIGSSRQIRDVAGQDDVIVQLETSAGTLDLASVTTALLLSLMIMVVVRRRRRMATAV
ncbi:MAG: hypothetical protein ACRD2X_16405 [Vicinamibacteraceae bacterium]